MATYNKFEDFALRLGEGVHQLHAAGHTLKVYLSNATPSASLDTVVADLADITAENGYTAGGDDVENDYTEASGTGTLSCKSGGTNVFTASGGTIGPFRYAVLYNDTPTSPADPLIAWWDYGSSITLQDGETFTVNWGASTFTLT
jgi:hypothetical protein